MRVWISLSLLGVVAFLTACAGGFAQLGSVDHTIGRATFHDIMIEVPEVLRRHGYDIYQNRPTASTLYIETGWQDRAPFDDEAKAGAEFARTRFIARARKDGPATYALTISAENQIQVPGDSAKGSAGALDTGWSTIPPTDMYKAYVQEIATEIKMKVDAGVRVYGAGLEGVAPLRVEPSKGGS